MTRSWESGENEFSEEAKKLAQQSKKNVCSILAAMLAAAKAEGDTDRELKIRQAQKYLGCRNIRKRESQ
jgi:uncharacterized membrane protein YebE (DUF533 family)